MTRIAVIGAGISGLAAAYYLSPKFEVHVFEKDTRLGGHTHTVLVDSSKGPLPVDAGFIVYNEKTYPNFCRLMAELSVPTAPSDMSFAVRCPRTGFEYSSRGARGFFADPLNAVRPRHWALLGEILRFNREAARLLEGFPEDLTLGQFVRSREYSADFLERYLYPMASAVWSMSSEATAGFPARTLIRFFLNHGMLGINTHPQWKFIQGGSQRYLDPLTARFRKNIHMNADIRSVTRCTSGVMLRFTHQEEMTFDQVVFACHGDQILPILGDASAPEREVLSSFATSNNEAVLHTDSKMLPRRHSARASWNCQIGGRGFVTVTYHMNRLQALNVPEDYCVTLNATGEIDSAKVIRRMVYSHPLYTQEAIRAQTRWGEISGQHGTHFCGAYWLFGFHEDGVTSALRVAQTLGVQV